MFRFLMWLFGVHDSAPLSTRRRTATKARPKALQSPQAIHHPNVVMEIPQAEQDDSDPLVSGVVAYATDSTLLGYVAGGSLPGAIVGDMLNDDDQSSNDGTAYDSADGGGGDDCGGDW
ncbi:hypothetical protein SAMN06265222_12023 [Neorhodopirellula lusitana]|uniref:Uncharacterized protein n=1 Tax=Neorhodopirellula lusitana TaxID=445327 RepID=A0ABY1QNT6_9BACT|nr:hypothetical protein [Neorhodopirellula lusitana]SMP75840.1 hypothetical protein SAMN06265222_12023 [Neorhodopirellula lusitana]